MEPCSTEDLQRAGALLFAQGNSQGIAVGGWRIESSEDHILGSRELLLLSTRLGNPYQSQYEVPFCVPGSLGSLKPCSCGSALVMGVRMHLPEGVFGHNWLQLVHQQTGARLRFDVGGALMQWVLSSVEHGSGGLKVPAASVGGWAERWPAMFQTQEYDWTYTTDYRGDATVLRPEPSTVNSAESAAEGAPRGVATQPAQSSQSAQSGLPCSLPECAAEANSTAAHSRSGSTEVATDLSWEDCGPGMIDMELLTRPEPILFYKHLILFEDFLHDNGVAQLSLKVRVMPSCWFVLLRYWLRVDGVIIRLRDTRCFHAFGSSVVIREHSYKEAPCPKPEPIPFPPMDSMLPRPMVQPPAEARSGTRPAGPAGPVVAAGQLPSRLPHTTSSDPLMGPPVIKVIDTPEEAAKLLQHRGAKEQRYEMLKLNSLVVKSSLRNNAGRMGADDSDARACQNSAMTLVLSPLDQGSGIELGDWVECCATAPCFAEPAQLLESFTSPAMVTGRVGFVAFGCADGEILLLKSCPAGEEMLDSVRFLGHGDLGDNFEAATLSLCFFSRGAQGDATATDENKPGASGTLLASSGEDGKLRVWSVDSLLAGKSAAQSLCCEVSGLDAVQSGADYRRRVDKDGKSTRVPSVQLVACPRTSFSSATMTETADGVGSANLAVATGRSVWLVELSSDWCSHRRSVQLGRIHSTATGLQFAGLPELGMSLLAACYGAVSIWDEATLRRGTEAPPTRTLDYKGPLLGLCVSMGGAFVGAGCQDGTMHVWKIAGDKAGPAAGPAAEEADSVGFDAARVVKGDQDLPRGVRTTAAMTEVSCGGYSEKVTCTEWSPDGFFLATAGGQHAIVWNFSDTSHDGSTGSKEAAAFPVGKKEAAAICCGHERRVTAMAFGPCAVDAQTQEVQVLLATADEAGLVLIFRISSSPEKLGTGAGDSRDHCGYEAGVPNIYRPAARCGPAAADGRAPTTRDGIARLAWVGSVLYTASDAGVVQRWAMDL